MNRKHISDGRWFDVDAAKTWDETTYFDGKPDIKDLSYTVTVQTEEGPQDVTQYAGGRKGTSQIFETDTLGGTS